MTKLAELGDNRLAQIRGGFEQMVAQGYPLGPYGMELLAEIDRLRAAILSALREGERLRGALDDIEDCMEVRLHGATVGNEAERPLATSCWGQALRDTQRIKAAALSSAKEPGHDA